MILALLILLLVGVFAVYIAHDLDKLARTRRAYERREHGS